MLLLPTLIAAIALQQAPDTWSLKPAFDPKAPKQVWALIVDGQSQGDKHHAVFQFTRSVKTASAAKNVVAYSWEHIFVDDHEGADVPAWDAIVGPQGQIFKMDGDTDDEYRRMLSGMVLVYPDKPVAVGDKWTVEVKPEKSPWKFTYNCEAKGRDFIENTNVLAVSVKMKEDGDGGVTGDGIWWVTRVGKLLKFEIKLTNWVVPMAGSDVTDVTIKGLAQ